LLDITFEAKEWLLAQNDQPEFGARPLRRLIARHLREPLADFLLTQNKREGKTAIIIDADAKGLRFEMDEE
jgi:ATP-dependent Clp protease ATP-binding subunit ClpB